MAQRAFACPKCKTKLTAPEGVDRFRCPNCKTILTAPAPTPQPPAQPQAQAPPPPAPAPPAPAPAPPKPQAQAPPPAPAPPQARLPEPQEQLEGRVLAGYRITRLIGSGGMGTVYEAVQEGLKRRVALKVLPVSIAQDTAFLTAFKREAQATAKLNHPNIIQIFDIIEEGGFNFFSMEFVDGESLGDRLKREGRLAIVDALQTVAQVGTALDHANEHMLIHRDIKPSNILLARRGDVKLADLGLSKSFEETAIGVVRGTHGGPVYMAPEFAQNPQIADCRSDIYALGAVLYHMLTGQPPFPGPTVADLIKQHAHSPLPSARAVVPELPEAVDELLQKMCAKDPAERCQTYEELLGQVQLLLKATSVRHPRIPSAASHRPRRRAGSRWLPIAIVAALVLAALAAAAIFLVPRLLGPSGKATAAPRTDLVAGDPEEPGEIEVVGPPPEKPATDDPAAGAVPAPPDEVVPEEPKEPDKPEEPKEPDKPEAPGETEPPEKKPEEPKAPGGEGELAKVQERAAALVGQMKFGEAIAALNAFAEGKDDEALKTKVAEAREGIEIQAAQAFADARAAAMGLVTKGKLPEAVTVLQAVVDTFGTKNEVGLAKATIQAIGRYQQGRKALADAARQAAAGAKAAETRAAEQARFAGAIEPIEALLAKWELAGALKQLDALKPNDPAVRKQIAQRKAAVQALAALQGKMIQLIKTAKPRLRKGDLRIRGLNGDLTDADEAAITIKTPMKVEKLPWAKLRDVSAKLLAQRAGKASSAEDLLGTALILRLLGEGEEAGKFLQRAGALGAQTDALGDPKAAAAAAQREAQAAKALAAAVGLAASGQHGKAADALAAYQEKFEDTGCFASAEKLFKAAKAFKPFAPPAAPKVTPKPKQPAPGQPTPKKPTPKPTTPPKKADPKAVAVYQSAVAAYRERNFDECRKRLDELKAKFPNDAILVDGKRKPSVPDMLKTIASQGDTLTVSPGGKHRSLADALAALKKPNSTIEIRASSQPYGGGATITGEAAQGLIIRGVGEHNPRFDGGGKPIIKLFPDTRGVWIGGLTLQSAKVGIAVDEGCSVTIRDCFAVKGIGAALDIRGEAVLDIADSVLKINALNGATIEGCCLLCGDTSIDYSRLRHCVLYGKDIAILGSSLTDCLIIGSVRVRDRAVLDHVTITNTATLVRDIRGARITNSILPTIEFDKLGDIRAWNRKTKKQLDDADETLNLTVTSSLLFQHRGDLPQVIVKANDLIEGKIAFRDPRRHDYRLPDSSRYLKKATDKTALGCRFTPEMLKRLRYVPH